jgi:hypothetical protein
MYRDTLSVSTALGSLNGLSGRSFTGNSAIQGFTTGTTGNHRSAAEANISISDSHALNDDNDLEAPAAASGQCSALCQCSHYMSVRTCRH